MLKFRRFLLTFILCTSSVSFAETCNIPTSVDLSINGIFLHDKKSQEKILGENVKFVDSKDSSPSTIFLSSTGNDYLKLLSHYGSIGEVAEFEISYANKDKSRIPKLRQFKNFVSGKGIYLGVSKARLLSILGQPNEEKSSAKLVTLMYKIEDLEGKNEFLSCYGMPIYYGNYIFKNNKLFKFQFGFEYP